MPKRRTNKLLVYFLEVVLTYIVLLVFVSQLKLLDSIVSLFGGALDREHIETFTTSILLTFSLVLPTPNMPFSRRLKVILTVTFIFLLTISLDAFFWTRRQHMLRLYREGRLSELGFFYYICDWGDRITVNFNYYLFPFLLWFLFCYKTFRKQ